MSCDRIPKLVKLSTAVPSIQSTKWITALVKYQFSKVLDPVVQNFVSLTMSLRHKFVKQISAKVTNTLLFFIEKM